MIRSSFPFFHYTLRTTVYVCLQFEILKFTISFCFIINPLACQTLSFV
jgi:hypothetical protein